MLYARCAFCGYIAPLSCSGTFMPHPTTPVEATAMGATCPVCGPLPPVFTCPFFRHPVPLLLPGISGDAATGLHLRGCRSGTAGRLEGDAQQRLRQGHGRAGGRDRQGSRSKRSSGSIDDRPAETRVRRSASAPTSSRLLCSRLSRRTWRARRRGSAGRSSLERYLRAVPDALGAALGMSKDPHCGRASRVRDRHDPHIRLRRGRPPARSDLRRRLGMLDDAYSRPRVRGLAQAHVSLCGGYDSRAYEAPDARTSEVRGRPCCRRVWPSRCCAPARARSRSPRRCFPRGRAPALPTGQSRAAAEGGGRSRRRSDDPARLGAAHDHHSQPSAAPM